jgi:hypothetical protein
MVHLGSEIRVWFGDHTGTEGTLAEVARRADEAIVFASVECPDGQIIRVEAQYCDPFPGRLCSTPNKERAA